MSSRPHERYSKVWFNDDWLEDWALQTLDISIDTVLSKSEFIKDKSKRAVMFWAMVRFAGLSQVDICRRYGQYQATVHRLITQVDKSNFRADREALERSLEPFLPKEQVKK